MRLLVVAFLIFLTACSSLRNAETDGVLWISGLSDRVGSYGLARLADERNEPLMAFNGTFSGNPRAIVGHSLGADRAARMALQSCPNVVVLLDPTQTFDMSRCRTFVVWSKSWNRRHVTGAKEY